jgi:hypothetical protein
MPESKPLNEQPPTKKKKLDELWAVATGHGTEQGKINNIVKKLREEQERQAQ